MLHVNVDLYHTTNRTATTNGPISLAGAASLGNYGYGNGTYIGNYPFVNICKWYIYHASQKFSVIELFGIPHIRGSGIISKSVTVNFKRL